MGMGLFEWCAMMRRTSWEPSLTVKVSVAAVKGDTTNWITLKRKVLFFTAE